MEIIDNAISEIDLKTIQDLLLSPAFPWYFNQYTIDENVARDDMNDFQLVHNFYVNAPRYGYVGSDHFKVIEPILDKLETRTLIRIKANLHNLLSFPVTNKPNWTAEEINNEIQIVRKVYSDMLLDG